MPANCITAAPMKGPMKMPIRFTPPSVDSARARRITGTASVRYFCRARLKTLAAIPTTTIAAASSQSPSGISGDSAAAARATALAAAAPTMAQRSPNFSVMSEAGRLKNQEPRPIRVTISAATATEAPRSRADSATTGRMAPSPMLNSSAGPNAGTAMLRRLKGAWLVVVIPFILGRAADARALRRRSACGLPRR